MKDSVTAAEAEFLKGPRACGSELLWALGTFLEFIRGFRARIHRRHRPRRRRSIIIIDSAAEAAAAVRDVTIPAFGLRYRVPKRRWFLNE